MHPSRFQRIIEYVLDNLFDVATILLAGYLVMRHQIRPFTSSDFGDLATWILAVLGLIAVSGLWDRNRRLNRIENLSQESRDLALRHLSGKVYANDFFLPDERITNRTFASANVILLSGMTLTRTTREYMYSLGQRLVAGASIRFMILEIEEFLLQELVSRSFGKTTADYWESRLSTVEEMINLIAKTPGNTGRVEVGHLPYIPSFGFVMTDPDEPHGVCFVELYHHESAESNPAFELRAADDTYWYAFFRRQFEIMWGSCRVEVLPKSSATKVA
jgi:hypothetical protein